MLLNNEPLEGPQKIVKPLFFRFLSTPDDDEQTFDNFFVAVSLLVLLLSLPMPLERERERETKYFTQASAMFSAPSVIAVLNSLFLDFFCLQYLSICKRKGCIQAVLFSLSLSLSSTVGHLPHHQHQVSGPSSLGSVDDSLVVGGQSESLEAELGPALQERDTSHL